MVPSLALPIVTEVCGVVVCVRGEWARTATMDKKPQPPARLVDAATSVLAATSSLLEGASKTAEATQREAAQKVVDEENERRQRKQEKNRQKKAKKIAAKKLHKQQQPAAAVVEAKPQPVVARTAAATVAPQPSAPRVVTELDAALSASLAALLKVDGAKLKVSNASATHTQTHVLSFALSHTLTQLAPLQALLDNSQLYCALVSGSKPVAFGRVLTDYVSTAFLLDVQSFESGKDAACIAVVDALLTNPKLERVENVFCSAAVDARFAQGGLYRKIK